MYYRKKYNVIYADPPWKDSKSSTFKINLNEDCAINYISNNDLLTMNVGDICNDACVLFLWVPGFRLDFSISLMKAWGFHFSTVAYVWKKGSMKLPGPYTMSQCEFVLVGRRKRLPHIKSKGSSESQFLCAPRGNRTMEKPKEIIESIDRRFFYGNRIELFARTRHNKKWDILGDQVDGDSTDYYLKNVDGNLIITKQGKVSESTIIS